MKQEENNKAGIYLRQLMGIIHRNKDNEKYMHELLTKAAVVEQVMYKMGMLK